MKLTLFYTIALSLISSLQVGVKASSMKAQLSDTKPDLAADIVVATDLKSSTDTEPAAETEADTETEGEETTAAAGEVTTAAAGEVTTAAAGEETTAAAGEATTEADATTEVVATTQAGPATSPDKPNTTGASVTTVVADLTGSTSMSLTTVAPTITTTGTLATAEITIITTNRTSPAEVVAGLENDFPVLFPKFCRQEQHTKSCQPYVKLSSTAFLVYRHRREATNLCVYNYLVSAIAGPSNAGDQQLLTIIQAKCDEKLETIPSSLLTPFFNETKDEFTTITIVGVQSASLNELLITAPAADPIKSTPSNSQPNENNDLYLTLMIVFASLLGVVSLLFIVYIIFDRKKRSKKSSKLGQYSNFSKTNAGQDYATPRPSTYAASNAAFTANTELTTL